MAIEKIVLQYEADVKKLKGDLKKAEKGLGAVQKKGTQSAKAVTKSFGGLRNSIVKVGAALAAAFAVQKLISFGKESLRLFDIQAKSETKLLVALKQRTDIQQRLIKQAQALQKITLFGDEAIINAQAFLATMGLNEDAITRLIPLVLDLATKQELDLKSSADLIAKSVGSSTNALSRYGIVIEGAVGSTERMESAITALNRQVGGQAAAAAKVGTGALTQLDNIIGDLQETIGGFIVSAMLPFIKGFQSMVIAITEFLTTPVSEKLEEERLEIALLGAAILATADNQALRNSLIDELNTKYPEVLKNLNTEILFNVDLKERLAEVNKELLNKIILQQKDEELDKARKKAAELFFEQRKAAKSLTDIIIFLSKARGVEIDKGKTLIQQAKELSTGRGVLVGRLGAFTRAEKRFLEAQEESIKLLTERINLQLELFGIVEPEPKKDPEPAPDKDPETKRARTAAIDRLEIRKTNNEDLIKIDEDFFDKRAKQQTDAIKKINETQSQLELDAAKKLAADKLIIRRQVEDEAFALTGVTADAIREISRNNADFELGVLRDKLESGAISQAEFDNKAKRIKTRQAQAEKDNALFGIALSTAQAIIKAVQASPETFGLPFSAFALATGLIQTAAVNSRPVPKFAKGVISIDGAGTATSDSIPSLLSRGESVMTAGETMKHKDALLAIRGDYMDRYINQNYVIPMLQKQSQGGNNAGAAMFDDFGIIRQLKKNSRVSSRNTGALAKQIGREVSNSNYFNDRY